MIPESIKLIFAGDVGPLSLYELEMVESMMTLEVAIFDELNDCFLAFKNNNETIDPRLVRLTNGLQCALDIVQSAKTNEERKRVFEILISLGKIRH